MYEKYDNLVAGLETKKDDNGNTTIGANGTFIRENNEVILIDENAYNNIANSKSRVGKSAMAYSPIHEAGHMYDNDVGVSKDGEVQEKHKKAVEETVKFLEDLDQDSDIDFIGTRGNSMPFDGVIWLEQLREQDSRTVFRAMFPPPKAVMAYLTNHQDQTEMDF